ncbi:MAG: sigma-70 family RNA polymerase sigma factor [Polyangiaceae bacterium]
MVRYNAEATLLEAATEPASGSAAERVRDVVQRDYALVWRFLRRLGVPASDVDDLAQIVFARVLTRAEVVAPGAERAYLMKAAYHAAFEGRRAVKRARERAAGIEPEELHSLEPQPDQSLQARQQRSLLDAALTRLTPELRAVFTLFELEELSFSEIAELLDIPRGTVASRLRKARQVFTEAVKRLETGVLEMTDDTEPPRLIHGDDAKLRSLLDSARHDAPSTHALKAAPFAIGALLASGAAEAAVATTSGVAIAVKWLTIGLVAGSVASAGAMKMQSAMQPATPAPSSLVVAAPRAVPRVAPAVEAVAPVAPEAEAVVVVANCAAPSAAPSTARAGADLAREIALLDSARQALASGNPSQALRQLDDVRMLTVRTLTPEATVLRVRALLQLGRRDSARQVVDQFAHDAPRSPQLAVLRELVHADSNL